MCVISLNFFVVFLCFFASYIDIIATSSLEWNVEFRRNLRVENGTLTHSNLSFVVFVKIQDGNEISNLVQLESALRLVQPILTLKLSAPSSSQSLVRKIQLPLCLLSPTSVLCEPAPDLDTIPHLCSTYRSSLNLSSSRSQYCLDVSGFEWVWMTEYQFPPGYVYTVSAGVESNTFGVEIAIFRSEFLLLTTVNVSAVPLQLKPSSQTAAGLLLRSWQVGTDVITLLRGDILIQHGDSLFTFDWDSFSFPVTCDSWNQSVSQIEVYGNGIIAATKYGVIWIEMVNRSSYSISLLSLEHCPRSLFVEKRPPLRFRLYALVGSVERGVVLLIGEKGEVTTLLEFNLKSQLSSLLSPSRISNLTITAVLYSWVSEEIMILSTDSEQSILATFDVERNISRLYKFPQHLPSQSATGLFRLSSASKLDGNISLIIRGMTTLSNTEILLWGSTLLYSPDFGRSFYWFSELIQSVSSVEVYPNGRAIVITQHSKVFYISLSSLELIELTHLHNLHNATTLLQLTPQNIIELISLSTSSSPLTTHYTIPSHSPLPDPDTYSPPNCSSLLNSTSLPNSSLPLLSHEAWLSRLSSPTNNSCSYSTLSLLSSHCATLTRDTHQLITPLQESPFYNPRHFSPSYLYNCTQKAEGLAPYIYLDKSYTFLVSVLFYLDASFPCLSQSDTPRADTPKLSVSMSNEMLRMQHTSLYLPSTHALQYTISLQVNQSLSNKLPSGSNIASSELKFRVFPSGSSCPALSSTSSTIVYIGCPSNLSIHYDREHSEGDDIWVKPDVCGANPNISCVFFDFGFTPRFLILDELQQTSIPFEGYYTLKPVAAGLTLDRMEYFDNVTNSLGLWAVTGLTDNPTTLHTELVSELQWICIYSSYCADINPSPEYGIPIYYLLLEFSTSLDNANGNLCHFTTQFTVLIYGIPLGPVATIVSFSVSLVIYIILLILGYPVYLYRKEIQENVTEPVYDFVYSTVEYLLLELTRYRHDSYLRRGRNNKVQASEQ